MAFALVVVAGCARLPFIGEPPLEKDAAAVQLLEVIRNSQPAPYGLPDGSTYNYIWAQFMLSLLAAERCGYMDREECVARLQGLLDKVSSFERFHGLYYDDYDAATGKPTRDQVYFQGWWIYGLAILKNAYPELRPICEKLLAEIDYTASGMFNPETHQLAADVRANTTNISYWIDLYVGSSGEMRTPYAAYTYLTGDISPWTKKIAPTQADVMGARPLAVWHNFFFCTMLVHSVFPDLGYFEQSWKELLTGMERYRAANTMSFFPTRAEALETGAGSDLKEWPNTEHRIAKPWLAWFGSADAPVMEKTWIPGYGVSLYYDNMNFYWSYGSNTLPCDTLVGPDSRDPRQRSTSISLPFEAVPPPSELALPHPPRVTSVQLLVALADRGNPPDRPLELRINGVTVAQIEPSELSAEPRLIHRTLKGEILTHRHNKLDIAVPSTSTGGAYRLYRRENSLWRAFALSTAPDRAERREPIPAPYVEIVIDGQHAGRENPFALLARCAVVHHYFVWQELLNDPQFLDNTVVWVGDYCRHARIGRVVHNTSDQAVEVLYDRPAEWTQVDNIQVVDISDSSETAVEARRSLETITWNAKPWHTYRVRYTP